jgi:hypothetical protein
MMISNLRAITLGLLLASAAPVLAEAAPPAAGTAPTLVRPPRSDMRGGGMFAGMSEAGRATMREAMKAGGDPRAEHQAVKAARDWSAAPEVTPSPGALAATSRALRSASA